ncbi:homocysteine-responsive endoplasmic reticulum-resident ubiquitin-like domain member 1 protein isoform X2 [Haplochromis burtoni]|uniref:homocysteine-responsive endoplasmic reticulum-resident ubiquitin-like domain member 1 protein isoform X2 n=1 Tax=Haplochromis burtoni TaxID=8153 RepID=UPI0003BD8074|nr:homocysteine-responsive endoplasmic reticulum-resident ubiquitin-like domain member 1 protein isoform X2 [Haplochromis burtoni]
MDAGNSEQKAITLIIKTPNQAQEDRTIEGVSLQWTIKELKAHLSAVYPTKPAVSDQRLIYAGKLLPDNLHINGLFIQTDSIPTLHLVCAVRNPAQGPLGARPKTKEPHSSSPQPTPAQTPSPPELRQRRPASAAPAHTQTPVWPPAAMTGAPQMTQPTFPTYSLYSPQQLLWLQHVYARQYYMQYHAALAAAGSIPTTAPTIGQYPPVPAHQVPVPAPLADQNPINNLPANQNPVQDGAFINPGEANQNMRMNAQGGAVVEDEEGMERDWLDWLYSAARFGVLMMIVYFNSNLSRFLLVMGTLLLMYLHTVGWFPFRRRVQVPEPNQLQPPENQQNQNRNPNLNPAGEHADRQQDEPAAGRPGFSSKPSSPPSYPRPLRLWPN